MSNPAYQEELGSETDSSSSDNEGSGSEDEVAAWIGWFCSLKGNEFFCEVDEEFIQDDFNLSGLSSQVGLFCCWYVEDNFMWRTTSCGGQLHSRHFGNLILGLHKCIGSKCCYLTAHMLRGLSAQMCVPEHSCILSMFSNHILMLPMMHVRPHCSDNDMPVCHLFIFFLNPQQA